MHEGFSLRKTTFVVQKHVALFGCLASRTFLILSIPYSSYIFYTFHGIAVLCSCNFESFLSTAFLTLFSHST